MSDNPYPKFFLMLAISFAVMYAVMFLNVYSSDHIYLSTTRFYMALLMVAPMAILMLAMMGHMYKNTRLNVLIYAGSAAVFVITLWFLRAQTFVADEQFMKAMIPHHSSAILTSEHADISDPELKKLSEEIIVTQKEEIAQMKRILDRLDNE